MRTFRYQWFAAVLVMAAATITPLHAQNYQLVWSDEFDGTTIDKNKWVFESGAGGWGNNELEYYTSRAVNATVDSGMLVITAQKENLLGSYYTSARMKTQGKASWTYGKVEARMKLPYGQGMWPAFWMLGDNISSVSWPRCGEIDIMEMIGGTGTRDYTDYGTGHWGDANGNHQSAGSSRVNPGGRLADDFHRYSITWTPQSIIWYLDDTPYYVLNITGSGLAAFQKSFFIILNLAVGGNWPGNPDLSTVFPQKLYVDYVRVYQDIPTSVAQTTALPKDFALEQNYPNPFNPSTTFRFTLPSAERVTLAVYNVMGEQVASVVDAAMAPGAHSVDWNASALPSGVYWYRLTAGGHSAVKKLIVQK